MSQTTVVPFGARAEQQPNLIELEADSLSYDPAQQMNVLRDGSLWCHAAMAPTCTNTNYDSKNDDDPDPYRMV